LHLVIAVITLCWASFMLF